MNFSTNFLFIIGYMIIGFVPYFGSIDKAPTQFFYLSLLNTLAIVFFFFKKEIYFKELKNILSKTYIIFLLLAVIWSFFTQFKAINTEEALIYSSRLLLYVITLINLIAIVQSSSNNLFLNISKVAAIILVIETILVLNNYYERFGLVTGRDMGLRAFTGNINITGIAMLLKVPFFLLLMYKLKGKIKVIMTLFFPIVVYTILLLGSKLANILLIVTLIVVFVTLILSLSKKKFTYEIVVLFCFIIPFLVNTYQFKNDKAINIVERTSNFNSKSTNERIRFYKQALNAILDNPIMGVGAGNWKIISLEYEKDHLIDYTVPINVHNDFLETAAEIGLVGFILKYYIYIILFCLFIKYLRKNKISESLLTIVSSLIIFFLDSSINFPFQRPVVYVFHLILLALIFKKINSNTKKEKRISKNNFHSFFILLLSIATIFPSYLVLDSYIDQNPLIAGIKLKKEYLSKEEVLNIRSNFPTISALTIPLDVYKANYLLNTKNLSDTILRLIDKGFNYNPFSYSGYALKSVYYINKDNIDSAEFYAKKAYYSQSNNKIHFNLYTDILSMKKDSIELTNAYEFLKKPVRYEFTEKYLRHINSIQNVFNENQKGIIEKYKLSSDNFFNALDIIDKIGKDDVFKAIEASKEGEKLYRFKKFRLAAEKFEEAIRLNPLEIAYYENCANAYMQLGEDETAIQILKEVISKLNPKTGKAEYLLAIIYLGQENYVLGCDYLINSKLKGFSVPDIVFKQFCNSENKQ